MKADTNLHPHMAATAWFRRMMDTKLHENADKGHWEGIPAHVLFDLMLKEVEELRAEIEPFIDNRKEGLVGDPVAIAREAADVANFAMMIADNARHGQYNDRDALLRAKDGSAG